MTEISFHIGVPHRLSFACRLLRKATRMGSRVGVTASPEALAALDAALWTFEPLDFLPHVVVAPGAAVPTRLLPTPIWLAQDVADLPHRDVLLNLGRDAPAGFESFARVVELVTGDEADLAAGRARWKHYASRGYPLQRHEVAA
jgi:DNA polymerase III subunit chi